MRGGRKGDARPDLSLLVMDGAGDRDTTGAKGKQTGRRGETLVNGWLESRKDEEGAGKGIRTRNMGGAGWGAREAFSMKK